MKNDHVKIITIIYFAVPGFLMCLLGISLIFQSIHIMSTTQPPTEIVENFKDLQYKSGPKDLHLPENAFAHSIDLGGGFELYIGYFYDEIRLLFEKHEKGVRYSTGMKRISKNDIIKKKMKFFLLRGINNWISEVIVKAQPENSEVRIKIMFRSSAVYTILVIIIVIGVVMAVVGFFLLAGADSRISDRRE